MIQLWMRWQKLNVRVKTDLEVPTAVKTSLDKFLMDHHQVSGTTGNSSTSNGKRCYLTHMAHTVVHITMVCLSHHNIMVLLIMADTIMVHTITVLIVMVHITIIQTFMLGNNGLEIIMIGQKICHKDQMPSVMEDKAGNSIDAKSSKTVMKSLKEELETLSSPKSP